jgi:ribosomal protein S21
VLKYPPYIRYFANPKATSERGCFFLPIIIKARNDDSSGDIVKKFKKIVAAADIVQIVKDRRYYQKPSEKRTIIMNEYRRTEKRARIFKKMKNIPAPRIPKRKPSFRDRD